MLKGDLMSIYKSGNNIIVKGESVTLEDIYQAINDDSYFEKVSDNPPTYILHNGHKLYLQNGSELIIGEEQKEIFKRDCTSNAYSCYMELTNGSSLYLLNEAEFHYTMTFGTWSYIYFYESNLFTNGSGDERPKIYNYGPMLFVGRYNKAQAQILNTDFLYATVTTTYGLYFNSTFKDAITIDNCYFYGTDSGGYCNTINLLDSHMTISNTTFENTRYAMIGKFEDLSMKNCVIKNQSVAGLYFTEQISDKHDDIGVDTLLNSICKGEVSDCVFSNNPTDVRLYISISPRFKNCQFLSDTNVKLELGSIFFGHPSNTYAGSFNNNSSWHVKYSDVSLNLQNISDVVVQIENLDEDAIITDFITNSKTFSLPYYISSDISGNSRYFPNYKITLFKEGYKPYSFRVSADSDMTIDISMEKESRVQLHLPLKVRIKKHRKLRGVVKK